MENDIVHVLPTAGQNTEDLAEAIRKVAAEQGMEDEVIIEHVGDHDIVVAPRSVVMPDSKITEFPPRNSNYAAAGTVELVETKAGGTPLMVIENFDPTVGYIDSR